MIYISDRGRIFAQAQRTVFAGSANRSFDLKKSPDTTTKGSDWRFEREALYGFTRLGDERSGSVKRLAVRFSRDASSCTMTIGYARAQGSDAPVIRGWYGEDYYLRRDEVTSSNCEVRTGNAFAATH